MSFEVGACRKFLVTQRAFIRLLSCMGHCMHLQVRLLIEFLATNRTHKVLLASMYF